MLSCDCGSGGDGDYEWYFEIPQDYQEYKRDRGVKCKSCGGMIRKGDICAEWIRFRYTAPGSIEERILGNDAHVDLASWWWCEGCADHCFNFTELGFCFYPEDRVEDLLREYRRMVEALG